MVDLDLNEPPSLQAPGDACHQVVPGNPRHPEQRRCWQVAGTGSLRSGLPSGAPAAGGAVNLLVKKVKRVGHRSCSVDDYRLRRLLHRGIRGRLTGP